ncbi:MAG TPA: ABC transporter permease [Ktedonosporobacter sp.]|nr:ABC transporter permease [Ktedonosporobacter sp.]
MSTGTKARPSRTIAAVQPDWQIQRGLLLKASSKAAIKALMVNGTRSFLTMLGVIIAVAAVIITVTQAEGTSSSINQRFASLGSDILTIQPGAPPNLNGKGGLTFRIGGGDSTLTLTDVTALTTLAHVVQASPILQTNGHTSYQSQNGDFQVTGVSTDYQTIHSLTLTEGSWFSTQDEETGAAKVVLGSVVAQSLFSALNVDPVGQMIRIGGVRFEVVGVLAAADFLFDQSIYTSFKAVQVRLTNTNKASQIEVLVDDVNNLDLVQQEITSLLEQRHRIKNSKDDFWVQSPSQFAQSQQASASSLAALLIGIAAVALTVGGIGIMNIMLVSVTERTREIGIRLATGARPGDIRNQFLIEAVVLSVLGGLIGVFFGLFTGFEIVTNSQLPFILDPGAILLAIGVAGLTGVIFGFYPAMRASQLDPVVALQTV